MLYNKLLTAYMCPDLLLFMDINCSQQQQKTQIKKMCLSSKDVSWMGPEKHHSINREAHQDYTDTSTWARCIEELLVMQLVPKEHKQ